MKGLPSLKSLARESIKKNNRGVASLEEMEAASKEALKPSIAAKRAKEKALGDGLDAGFYATIVFATKKERDAYFLARNIHLYDGEFIFGHEVDVCLKK